MSLLTKNAVSVNDSREFFSQAKSVNGQNIFKASGEISSNIQVSESQGFTKVWESEFNTTSLTFNIQKQYSTYLVNLSSVRPVYGGAVIYLRVLPSSIYYAIREPLTSTPTAAGTALTILGATPTGRATMITQTGGSTTFLVATKRSSSGSGFGNPSVKVLSSTDLDPGNAFESSTFQWINQTISNISIYSTASFTGNISVYGVPW